MPNDAAAKQWALAATAILTTMTRRAPRHDLLGGAERNPEAEATAKTILGNSWGVTSRDTFIATMENLGGTGASAQYMQAAQAFPQAPPQAQQGDPRLRFVAQYGQEIGNRGLVAWDLGRVLAVAGWGTLAGFCSEEEAWGAILPSADRLRATYGSWEEYAHHYRLGAMFEMPNAVADIDRVLGQLNAAPDNPWRAIPWRLDPNAPPAAYGAPPQPGPPVGAPGGYGPPPGGAPGGYGPPPGGAAPGGGPGAPPPGGGAPAAFGGVPIIAPTGGAPPPGFGGPPGGVPGLPGGGGKSKTMLFVGLGVGALLLLLLVVFLVVHLHHSAPPPNEPPHGEHHRGRH